MRGDYQGPGYPKISLLAGPQYRIGHHTITFARRPQVGDALTAEMIVEMDGQKPHFGDPIPMPLGREIFRIGWGA